MREGFSEEAETKLDLKESQEVTISVGTQEDVKSLWQRNSLWEVL